MFPRKSPSPSPPPTGDGPLGGNAETGPLVTEETACVQTSLVATEATRPVDIIFAVGNGSTMRDEIREIERQINTNFANVLETSGIDYRVAVMSAFGPARTPEDGGMAPLFPFGQLQRV